MNRQQIRLQAGNGARRFFDRRANVMKFKIIKYIFALCLQPFGLSSSLI